MALAAGFTGLHGNPMRLLPDGPDIPAELITAQEKGDVLFVCGAGVSRTVGLPSFQESSRKRLLATQRRLEPASGGTGGHAGRQTLMPSTTGYSEDLERRLAASDAPRHSGMRERIRGAVRAGHSAQHNLMRSLSII